MNPVDTQYASGAMRDAFLLALDGDDPLRSRSIARELATCGNPLPGLTCDQLDLPHGSTYGTAARRLLEHAQQGEPEGAK